MPLSPSLHHQSSGRLESDEDILHVAYNTPPRSGVYGNSVSRTSRRSSAFDVPIDGAIETPRGFKGYTLGTWARNNTAVSSSPVSIPSPGRAYLGSPGRNSPIPKLHARDCNCMESQLYRQSLERRRREADLVVEDLNDPPVAEEGVNQDLPASSSVEEDGIQLGCAVAGPVFPIVGKLSLMQVGWSTFLKDRTFLMLRLLQFVLALATLVMCTISSYKSKKYILFEATAVVFVGFFRRFWLVYSYRCKRNDKEVACTRNITHGFDGLVYQCTGIILVYTSLAAGLGIVSPTFAYLTGGAIRFDAGFALVMVLSAVQILDVWSTPIPFRLFYVFLATLVNVLLTAFAISFAGTRIRSGILTIVGLTSIAVGILLHLYSRAIYLCIHRERVIVEQKITPIAGIQVV